MKTAPVLLFSLSTLSSHLRLPHFSLLLLTCFHLRCATKRKRKSRFVPEEHQRCEKRRKENKVFNFLVYFFYLPFPVFINSVSPENRDAGVSFRVDTGTLGTATLSWLSRKNCFIRLAPWRIIHFLFPLFLFWKHVDGSKERRSDGIRDKDVESFYSVKKPSPCWEFKDMHQRQFHVCVLCSLFDALWLIMLPVESYNLSASLNSKHNNPVCSAL